MDQNQQSRRGHYNRGRRGPDRRGPDRRTPAPQAQEQGGRDHVDVEHIMRDIRARIAQRHGIDLSNQQIQELAARRLEAILDPRAIKPGLLDELRKSAGAPPPAPDPAEASELTYTFEDRTLYESHRGLMRFMRRLLNPILKLFFNPNPLIHALNTQARWNAEAVTREADRVRRQTEWNALHYELVHRMVTDVSRVTLELQSLSSLVESLSAKVDFNERRVRSMEGSLHQPRPSHAPSPSPRSPERERGPERERAPERERGPEPATAPMAAGAPAGETAAAAEAPAEGQTSDSSRRRRRRRRGRRGGGAPGENAPGSSQQAAQPGSVSDMNSEAGGDEGPDDEPEQDEREVVEVPPVAEVAIEAAAPPDAAPAVVEPHVPEPAPPALPAPGEREPEA